MKTPKMHIAMDFGEIISALRANGVSQDRINEIEDNYCNDLGQYGLVRFYTHDTGIGKYEPEIRTVLKQWIHAKLIPNGDKYEYIVALYNH